MYCFFAMYVVCLYLNIPHDESWFARRKRLCEIDEKEVSTDSLVVLGELVLKNGLKTLKQKRHNNKDEILVIEF